MGVTDMLALSTHLPEIEVPAEHVLVEEGGSTGSIWVLVRGSLSFRDPDNIALEFFAPPS